MNKIISFLESNKNGNLATSVNNEPHVRPFEYGYKNNNGIYFYTSDDKAVYSQLKENSKICFCSTDKDLNYVELHGNVTFSDNVVDKERIIDNSNFAKQTYKSANNEHLRVFYLPHGEAMLHSFKEGNTESMKF